MVLGSLWQVTKPGGVQAWIGSRGLVLPLGTILTVRTESSGVYQRFHVLAGSEESTVDVHRDDVEPYVHPSG